MSDILDEAKYQAEHAHGVLPRERWRQVAAEIERLREELKAKTDDWWKENDRQAALGEEIERLRRQRDAARNQLANCQDGNNRLAREMGNRIEELEEANRFFTEWRDNLLNCRLYTLDGEQIDAAFDYTRGATELSAGAYLALKELGIVRDGEGWKMETHNRPT
jgi:chromosome segregation ATPase